jgi:hypothetical protein
VPGETQVQLLEQTDPSAAHPTRNATDINRRGVKKGTKAVISANFSASGRTKTQ